ncbi:hypothetical protein REH70_07780 [Cellulomonas sp. ATA003]|nr:hypothetical protein [Cellulomonas sp. ATA003]WNB87025.1 hypothetical protein REH70_07780 [Cellulomonas sp. ATA003]
MCRAARLSSTCSSPGRTGAAVPGRRSCALPWPPRPGTGSACAWRTTPSRLARSTRDSASWSLLASWPPGLLVYGPNLYAGVIGAAGANAEIGLHVLTVALTLVGSVAFPLGAALIGAAVVIETVAPQLAPRPGGSHADAEEPDVGAS